MEFQSEIRIYVACLAAYNSGILYGAWIDATQCEKAIRAEVSKMLKASPIAGAEEFAIHDYEGFEGVRIEEYTGLGEVAVLADYVETHGAFGAALYQHFGDLAQSETALRDHYAGCYQSLADFAQELTEETQDVPENLKFYIDYEAMGRDLAMSDVFTIETAWDEHHVFWSH